MLPRARAGVRELTIFVLGGVSVEEALDAVCGAAAAGAADRTVGNRAQAARNVAQLAMHELHVALGADGRGRGRRAGGRACTTRRRGSCGSSRAVVREARRTLRHHCIADVAFFTLLPAR